MSPEIGFDGARFREVLAHLPTMAHPRPRLVAAITSVLAVGLVPYLVALTFVPGALPG